MIESHHLCQQLPFRGECCTCYLHCGAVVKAQSTARFPPGRCKIRKEKKYIYIYSVWLLSNSPQPVFYIESLKPQPNNRHSGAKTNSTNNLLNPERDAAIQMASNVLLVTVFAQYGQTSKIPEKALQFFHCHCNSLISQTPDILAIYLHTLMYMTRNKIT